MPQSKSQSQSKDPFVKAEKVETFVLYDPADGRVVHLHQSVVLPGGKSPSHEEIEKHVHHTFSSAPQHHGKKAPIDTAKLKGLHHSGEELKPHVRYKVDLATSRLVEHTKK